MAIKYWIGSSTSTSINEANNWSPTGLPGAQDTIIFGEKSGSSCTGDLNTPGLVNKVIVKSGFLFDLGTSNNPSSITAPHYDIRGSGSHHLKNQGDLITDFNVYGSGTISLTGNPSLQGTVTNLKFLGSTTSGIHPAYKGSFIMDNTINVTNLVVDGSCGGLINLGTTVPITNASVDGRGVSVTLQTGATYLHLEGAVPGFINKVILNPAAATTFGSVRIESNHQETALLDIRTDNTISDLYMDGGTLDYKYFAGTDGASITQGELYGSALVDMRSVAEFISMSNTRVYSESVDLKFDNGALVNIQY